METKNKVQAGTIKGGDSGRKNEGFPETDSKATELVNRTAKPTWYHKPGHKCLM